MSDDRPSVLEGLFAEPPDGSGRVDDPVATGNGGRVDGERGAGIGRGPATGGATPAAGSGGAATPVTVVITWNVVPGREAVFEEWAHGITEAGRRWPGHLSSNWFRLGQGANRYRTVIRFADEETLRRWMTSDERRDWLTRVEGYTRRSEEQLTGMETWFTLPGAAEPVPARWKMFVVTVVCSYLISLAINLLLRDLLSAVPLAVRVLITTVTLVAALTWLALPRATRLLRPFLYGRDQI